MTNASGKLAFLDRDGVINEDLAYVGRVEDFHLIDGVPQALKMLKDAGYALVIVTNQSGIGRGYFNEQDYARVTEQMNAVLAKHGVSLDLVLHCSHHPDAGCDCRKPAPGMLIAAAAQLRVELGAAVLFGDKSSDIAAGRAAGVATCFRIGTREQAKQDGAEGAGKDLLQCVRALLEPPAKAAC